MLEYNKTLFNEAWDTGVKLLYERYLRKSDRHECKNYRGISVLTHMGKTYERILEGWLRKCVKDKLGKWQHGFRPKSVARELIFVLRMLLEK